MRVLVFEQWHFGHHYHSVHHLLPRLADEADEVVVAVTASGRKSQEFATLLAPMAGRVGFDDAVPDMYRTPTMYDRWRLLGNLHDAVRRVRPDYVLVPSADYQTRPMAVFRLMGGRSLPGGVPGEAGFHYGNGPYTIGLKQRAKEAAVRRCLRFSAWKRLNFVNPLVCEALRAGGGSLARRAEVIPHPVPSNPRLDRGECRRRLGLPEDGRYIGMVAAIDHRKAIPQLLAAFREGAPRPDDRLLLVGRMLPAYADLIRDRYGDLVDAGRVVTMNTYVDAETADNALRALDVVCAPYPGFTEFSSAALHGLAAGRPVLVNDFAWSGAMVRRFGFGWACDVLNHDAFTSTLREALEGSGGYVETEATRRLLAFYEPSNFAECWLTGVRAAMGKGPTGRARTWSWVLDAVDEERRYLL